MIIHSLNSWQLRLSVNRIGSVALLVFISMLQSLQAQEEADPTVKLREQLRAVTLQLRTAQTESANAQAITAATEQKSKDLATKIDDLEKRNTALIQQSTTDKATAVESIASLEAKLSDREKRIIQFQEALQKWKDGYEKAAAIARSKEEERATLAAELASTKNTLADRERKNIGLFNTANEVLDRFENYALGKALAAREPFIGTTRVKVENLVQGYKDKIVNNRIEAKND
ncbi:MAG: phage major capsid protein [Verrucomicrobiota bacterium]